MKPAAHGRTSERHPPVTTALVLLIVIAFSDEFLFAGFFADRPPDLSDQEAVRLESSALNAQIWVDAVVLVVMFLVGLRIGRRYLSVIRRASFLYWLAGAIMIVLADILTASLFPTANQHFAVWYGLVASVVYAVALAMLLAGTIRTSPLLFVWAPLRKLRVEDWLRLRTTIPLLLGIFVAYLAGVWWDQGLGPAPGGASEVDKEFFAQLSQVMPLLVVALGIEANYFRSAFTEPTQRAAAIVTISLLCLGEALALSVLVVPAGSEGEVHYFSWHVYSAFVLSVIAFLIGIVTLIGVLVLKPSDARRQERTRVTRPTIRRLGVGPARHRKSSPIAARRVSTSGMGRRART